MKDDVAIVLEAIRRAQAKVAFYLEPGRHQRAGLQELAEILEDELLLRATRALSPGHSYIPLVPDEHHEEVAPAPPLSR